MIDRLAVVGVLVAAVICGGCMKKTKAETARAVIGDKVLIVLAKEPDRAGTLLAIQDYILNGESYIPFFTSEEAFQQSTRGAELGKPVWAIDRRLFVELTHNNQIHILNIGLPNEMRFTGQELKQIFPEHLTLKEDAQQNPAPYPEQRKSAVQER